LGRQSMTFNNYLTFFFVVFFTNGIIGNTPQLIIQKNEPNHNKMVVVIDPGHGGHDPGCSGTHVEEKDICLKIAKKLGHILSKHQEEIEVIYTRTEDIFIPLYQRIQIANQVKADLFISIHCNSSTFKSASGSESYVMGIHQSADNLNVAKRENQVITLEKDYQHNYGSYDPNSPVGHIILSTYQNLHLDQSISLANKIEKTSTAQSKLKSRGVKQAGFVVLRNAMMPSVLFEAGFLSNPKNENYLSSNKGQKTIAIAISKAILEYHALWITNNKSIANLVKKQVVKDQQVKASFVSLQHKNQPTNHHSGQVTTIFEKETETYITPINKTIKVKHQNRYRVQLAATTQKTINIQSGKWSTIKDITILKQNNLYKYYSRICEDRASAEQLKETLRAKGFKGAFIVCM